MAQDNSETILPVLSRLSLGKEERPLTNILTAIAKEGGEHMLRKYAQYIPLFFEACKDRSNPHIQQMAACAIGKYVEFDRETFKHHLRDGLSSLEAIMVSGAPIDDLEHWIGRDAVVSAYGKLCFFLSEEINSFPNINLGECMQLWLSHLPIKCNFDEAKAAHKLLCSMIDKPETKVTGPGDSYIGIIVAIMAEVLWGVKHIATQEIESKMIQQLKMFKQKVGEYMFESICESLPPHLHNMLNRYLSSSSYANSHSTHSIKEYDGIWYSWRFGNRMMKGEMETKYSLKIKKYEQDIYRSRFRGQSSED